MRERTSTVDAVDSKIEERVDEEQVSRDRFWQAVESIRERNRDKDPEEEFAFITQVVEEVRQERYEREQRAKSNG